VLGGNPANFTLDFNFENQPEGFVPAPGLERVFGALGANNKPVWVENPPKGLAMMITPTTGLVSGKIPDTQNGKAAVLSYQACYSRVICRSYPEALCEARLSLRVVLGFFGHSCSIHMN
jgi:hypothetical protein